jgi:TPR repeat protein
MPQREAAVQYLTDVAAHCPLSGYSAGQLYRHGDRLPGNLVARDPAKAQQLIRAAAEAGHLFAYADLAEMALAEGRTREAMQWTQVYLYLVIHHSDGFDPASGSFTRSGYNGDLLARALRAWRAAKPRLEQKTMQEDLTDYLRGHEATVVERLRVNETAIMKAGKPTSEETEELRVVAVKGGCEADLGSVSSAYAMYLVEVQPSGAVSRVVLENFSPSVETATRLRKCAQVYQFGSFKGTKPKVGRIPVIYGFSDGASLRVRK